MNALLLPNLLPPFYLILHTTLSLKAQLSPGQRVRIVVLNLAFGAYFLSLVVWGASLDQPKGWHRFLILWSPIVFFWWAYLWSKHTLTAVHEVGTHFDAALIRLESGIGQPSLRWAKGGNRLLTEVFHVFYFSYYLYTPIIAIYLDVSGRLNDFVQMSFAVTFGYLVSYVMFALTPVYGPRWSLVEEGLLSSSEQRAEGYWITRFINQLMYGGPAIKGGAMPSSHTSTAAVFWYWCWLIWGIPGGLIGAVVTFGMALGAVYGRYHFVTDIIAGVVLGGLGILLAEVLLGP